MTATTTKLYFAVFCLLVFLITLDVVLVEDSFGKSQSSLTVGVHAAEDRRRAPMTQMTWIDSTSFDGG